MEELIENIFAVPIPEDAVILEIHNSILAYDTVENTETVFIPLPNGNWEFLFTTSTIDEEKAKMVVEMKPHKQIDRLYETWYYPLYGNIRAGGVYVCKTATESFKSLLQSKSLTGNYAIIKKLK